MSVRTSQEEFWAGSFGDEYRLRNRGLDMRAANVHLFARMLKRAGRIDSCLEVGANVGMNIQALQSLYPHLSLFAVEINKIAAQELGGLIGEANVTNASIFDWLPKEQVDLSFTKGVLIHIAPERLPEAYERIYNSSKRLILVAEYYSPYPVAVEYRGHSEKLFKRDFAGEMLSLYPDLRLIDYGFAYKGDPVAPHDDINWFLMERSR